MRGVIVGAVAVTLICVIVITGEPILVAAVLPFLVNLLSSKADRWLENRSREAANLMGRVKFSFPSTGPRARSSRRLKRRSERQAPPDPKAYEQLLRTAALCLLAIGAAMVFSSVSQSPGLLASGPLTSFYVTRFLIFAGIGLLAMRALSRQPLSAIRAMTGPLIVVAFVLLILTLIPGIGSESYGARRWVGVGLLQIQASELMKLALILYSAQLVSLKKDAFRASPLLPSVGALLSACLLIIVEPDLGAAFVCVITTFSVLFAAGFPLRRFALNLGAFCALFAVPVLWNEAAQRYFFSFLNPWESSTGTAFQAQQSLIAVGSGGFFGRGFGESIQKAFYLPYAYSDYILAVIGEELGTVGVLGILTLLGMIVFAGLSIALRARANYAKALAVGLTTLIGGQGLLNVFSVLGLAPQLGASLPLVSYGSSLMLTTLMAIGILISISRETRSSDEGSAPIEPPSSLRASVTNRRIGATFAVFLLMLGIASLRALWIGTVEAKDLRAKAEAQQIYTDPLPARRGPILDRHGKPLAESEPASEVILVSDYLDNPEETVARLAPLLSAIPHAKQRLLNAVSDDSPPTLERFRPLSPATGREVEDLDLPGVLVVSIYDRDVEPTLIGRRLIGSVNFFDNGATALEKHFDQVLDGDGGVRLETLNGLGEPLREETTQTPKAGRSIQLTIDASLQQGIEEAVEDPGLLKAGDRGSVLVLDAEAHLLAMADSAPATEDDPPLTPSIIARAFEPGSTLGIVTAAGALEEGLVTPTETFLLPALGADETVGDSSSAAGRLSVSQILAESNEMGTILMALRLGANRLNQWMDRFGFGRTTGLEFPAEPKGLLPRATTAAPSTLGQLPVGRGGTVTLIQLANAYATIANEGFRSKPTVISRIDDASAHRNPATKIVMTRTANQIWRAVAFGVSAEVPSVDPRTGSYTSAPSSAVFVGLPSRKEKRFVVAIFVRSELGSGLISARRLFQSAEKLLTGR